MAQSYETYTALGGQDTYAVPFPYLKKAHVVVSLNGVTTTAYTWLSPSQIKFNTAVAAGVVIKFARVTPETPLFNSADGTVLTDAQLKVLGRQSIYLAQETNDRSNVTLSAAEDAMAQVVDVEEIHEDLEDFGTKYLGPKSTPPSVDNEGNPLIAGALYFDTTSSALCHWTGSAWVAVTSGLTQTAGDARYLRLVGGTLTGALTLPAADPTADGHAARKAYVDSKVAAVPVWSTGDIKWTWKTVADPGWVMHTNGTIGSAASGATFANASAQALYTLIYNAFDNSLAPVTGGRGASPAADWAANKPIKMPEALGYTVGVAGAGSGLTARALGAKVGAETNTATTTLPVSGTALGFGGDNTYVRGAQSYTSAAFSVMQPTTFWNVMVKL